MRRLRVGSAIEPPSGNLPAINLLNLAWRRRQPMASGSMRARGLGTGRRGHRTPGLGSGFIRRSSWPAFTSSQIPQSSCLSYLSACRLFFPPPWKTAAGGYSARVAMVTIGDHITPSPGMPTNGGLVTRRWVHRWDLVHRPARTTNGAVCLPLRVGLVTEDFDRSLSSRPGGAPPRSLALTGRPSYGVQAVDYATRLLSSREVSFTWK